MAESSVDDLSQEDAALVLQNITRKNVALDTIALRQQRQCEAAENENTNEQGDAADPDIEAVSHKKKSQSASPPRETASNELITSFPYTAVQSHDAAMLLKHMEHDKKLMKLKITAAIKMLASPEKYGSIQTPRPPLPSSSSRHWQHAESGKPILTKPLMRLGIRHVPTEDSSGSAGGSTSESRSTTVPKVFSQATRVWNPKVDYQKQHENTIVKEREKYCRQVLETGTFRIASKRSKPLSPRPPFAVLQREREIPHELERVIDLSFLPPQSEEQVEKITERLSRVKPKPTPAVAEPTPPLDRQNTGKLLIRLTTPSAKKQQDLNRKRYTIIKPIQRDPEEIDLMIEKFAKLKEGTDPSFKSKASERKISAKQSQELVARLSPKRTKKERAGSG